MARVKTFKICFYDGTVDYCICFLIFSILSLSSISLLNSLFPHFVSLSLSELLFSTLSFSSFSLPLSLSELLSTLTLSLCAVGWAPTPVCGSWVNGSVDRQVWSSGSCGFFFFFFGCDRCLKEEVGIAEVGRGSLKSIIY